jgi:hypothetical protein
MKGKYKYEGGGKPGKKGKKGPRFSRMIGGPVRYKGGWEDKLEDLVQSQLDKLSERYGWAPDYRDAELPEDRNRDDLPSFYDFVSRQRVESLYDKALPLDDYTTTYNLGPISLQRWKNAKQSPDGVNYRTPYYATGKWKKTGENVTMGKTRANAGVNLGDEQNDIIDEVRFGNYKLGHQKEKLDNTLLDKFRQTPGSVFPPANTLLAGGASTGGRHIEDIAAMAYAAKTYNDLYKQEKTMVGISDQIQDASAADRPALVDQYNQASEGYVSKVGEATWFAPMAAILGGGGLSRTDGLVIPTAGIMRNPLQKAYKQQEKKFKKTLEDADERYESDREDYLVQKSQRELDRYLDAYQEEYGIRPVFKNPPITKTPRKKASEYVIPNGRRGENRNPIYLMNGGKVKLKKK